MGALRYLRAVIVTLVIILWTLIMGLIFIPLTYFFPVSKVYFIVKCWAFGFLKICGLKIEKIKEIKDSFQTQGQIFLFNHQSFIDIPALVWALPGVIQFVSKEEILKLPIVGATMKRVGTLALPRRNLQRCIELYKKAELRISAGESFIIAPEGTRGDGAKILDFKSGPFILALNAKAHITPVIIKSTAVYWPKKHLIPCVENWGGELKLSLSEPISTHSWTEENRKSQMETLKLDFQRTYNRL